MSIATRGLAASASARVFGAACAGAPGRARAGAPPTVGWAAPGVGVGRRLGLRLRLLLGGAILLQLRRGEEILPTDQHQDRQRDRQDEVAGVLGIHDRGSLSVAVGLARPICAKARSTSATSAAKRRVNAGRRATST